MCNSEIAIEQHNKLKPLDQMILLADQMIEDNKKFINKLKNNGINNY